MREECGDDIFQKYVATFHILPFQKFGKSFSMVYAFDSLFTNKQM